MRPCRAQRMDVPQRSGVYERRTRAKNMAKTLFEEVRSEQNIFSAWRHVKRSALTSGNADIRGKASEFEHTHQRHLRRIIDQLRTGRLSFDPVECVLKDKRKRLAAGPSCSACVTVRRHPRSRCSGSAGTGSSASAHAFQAPSWVNSRRLSGRGLSPFPVRRHRFPQRCLSPEYSKAHHSSQSTIA